MGATTVSRLKVVQYSPVRHWDRTRGVPATATAIHDLSCKRGLITKRWLLLQRRAAMDVSALLGSRGLFDAAHEEEDEEEEEDYYFTDDSDLEP